MVVVWAATERQPDSTGLVTAAEFEALLREPNLFQDIAAFAGDKLALMESSPAEEVLALRTTPNLTGILGLQLRLGRDLDPELPEGALLSHRLWKSRWGGQDSILRDDLRLEGDTRSIQAVLPPEAVSPAWSRW